MRCTYKAHRAGGVVGIIGLVIGLVIGLGAIPASAYPAVIDCSVAALKSAIIAADAAGGGTINLAPSCTYALTAVDNDSNGLPPITQKITINGDLATIERVAGSPSFRIFEVSGPGGNLTLTAITLQGGQVPSADGGAVLVDAGCGLTVRNGSTITGSTALDGGGISTSGSTTVTSSTISNNTAGGSGGGGIYVGNGGSLKLGSATVTGNSVVSNNFGGGIFAEYHATTSIFSSSITDNTARLGGGVFNRGVMTMGSTSITGNTAGDEGGGLYNVGLLTLFSVAFTDNIADQGGGLFNEAKATINSGVFERNTATIEGGGLFALHPDSSTTLNSSIVTLNTAGTTAGGIYSRNSVVNLTFTTVTANSPNNCLGSSPPVTGCSG